MTIDGAAASVARLVLRYFRATSRAADRASEVFCNDILWHGAVEREVRHQRFQLALLFLELAQPPHFAHPEPAKHLPPGIERLAVGERVTHEV